MSKKLKKIAIIRDNNAVKCPFGLPISHACKMVGKLINNMAPVNIMGEGTTKEEQAAIAQANKHLFLWNNENQKCPFARTFVPKNEKIVECTFNEEDTDIQSNTSSIDGSPLYYKHFSGSGVDGLYSYPLGYYSDTSIDRGVYYGAYSLESINNKKKNKELMIKHTFNPLPNWDNFIFMNNDVGFYIKEPNKNIYYGPFKNNKYAEFFNYLAFCSPKDLNGEHLSKNGICSYNNRAHKINVNARHKFIHPKHINFDTSPFGYWWIDTFGHKLTAQMALRIAIESGGYGYKDFRKWLLNGCKLDGKPIHLRA